MRSATAGNVIQDPWAESAVLTLWLENHDILHHVRVRAVGGPVIRHDPFHARGPGSLDQRELRFRWGLGVERDDQRILAFQRVDDRLRTGVVDDFRDHAFWKTGLAAFSGQGRDCVFSSLEQGLGYEATAVASCLGGISKRPRAWEGCVDLRQQ